LYTTATKKPKHVAVIIPTCGKVTFVIQFKCVGNKSYLDISTPVGSHIILSTRLQTLDAFYLFLGRNYD